MDKAMRQYYAAMTARLKSQQSVVDLRHYHAQRISEFQHERLVHLIVTLFFAGLTLLFSGVFIWTLAIDILSLSILAGTLAVVTLGLELGYIVYYYRLENGLQRLYRLTDQLFATKQD